LPHCRGDRHATRQRPAEPSAIARTRSRQQQDRSKDRERVRSSSASRSSTGCVPSAPDGTRHGVCTSPGSRQVEACLSAGCTPHEHRRCKPTIFARPSPPAHLLVQAHGAQHDGEERLRERCERRGIGQSFNKRSHITQHHRAAATKVLQQWPWMRFLCPASPCSSRNQAGSGTG